MIDVKNSIILIAVMCVISALLRFLPFIIFPGGKETPPVISYLGKYLPPASVNNRLNSRAAGVYFGGCGNCAAFVEKEHFAEHSGGNRLLYGADSAGVCIKRGKQFVLCVYAQVPRRVNLFGDCG